jgi:c-di-GMP-binding flagellar brake protein YcgR
MAPSAPAPVAVNMSVVNFQAKNLRRRRVPRREFLRRIGLLVRGQYFVDRSLQIGEGGMMISSPKPLVEGQYVVITFKLPGHQPEVVKGQVRYALKAQGENTQSPRYGVEFVNLDFNIKRKIRNYVALQASTAEG